MSTEATRPDRRPMFVTPLANDPSAPSPPPEIHSPTTKTTSAQPTATETSRHQSGTGFAGC